MTPYRRGDRVILAADCAGLPAGCRGVVRTDLGDETVTVVFLGGTVAAVARGDLRPDQPTEERE